MISGLNHVDLVFVVDTTGSMGPFIEDARKRLVDCVGELGSSRAIDLQFGIVEYRDHPPQEASFVTRAYPLTGNLESVRTSIAGSRLEVARSIARLGRRGFLGDFAAAPASVE